MRTWDHAVLDDCRAISAPPRIGPRLLYLHIPRSGGSNLWHSSAQALFKADRSIQILDIYHESLRSYNTIHETKRTIKNLGLPAVNRCFVHHHTSFGLWRLLGEAFTYFTLLRDPVERAISHYFHSLNRHYDVDMAQGTYRLKYRPENNSREPDLGDCSLKLFRQISEHHDLLSPETIPIFIAKGRTSNFYVNLMYRYFEIKGEHKSSYPPCRFIQFKVHALAEKMKRHFAGIFFSTDDAFAFLEGSFEQRIEERSRMPNSAPRPHLENPERLRRSLIPYFRHDYQLMKLLGSPAHAPDA